MDSGGAASRGPPPAACADPPEQGMLSGAGVGEITRCLLMRMRMMSMTAAALLASLAVAAPSWAQNPGATRFGIWDNSGNPNNVMTYEADGADGMKITISNPSDPKATWSYVTKFDGVFRPVTGQQNSETAVEVVSDRVTRIYNKRNGVVYQVVMNQLSEDGNTIDNYYVRVDKDGKMTGVSYVKYVRRQKK
jgi:hypothetical protein